MMSIDFRLQMSNVTNDDLFARISKPPMDVRNVWQYFIITVDNNCKAIIRFKIAVEYVSINNIFTELYWNGQLVWTPALGL